MARTQAADYEQRREAILTEAAALFAGRGSRGASIADIAQACGMSKSLVYYYYGSKEEILYAVMASHIDQLEQDVAEVMAQGGTPAMRLRAIVHRFMRHYTGAASRQKVLLNELENLPPARRETIVSQQRRIVDVVTGLLQGVDPGLAGDPVRARARAMLLFGMINWTHTWFDPAGAITPAALADMALAMLLREPVPGAAAPRLAQAS